jgi:hypothetical protein
MLLSKIRTLIHEGISLLSVLKFPFRVLTSGRTASDRANEACVKAGSCQRFTGLMPVKLGTKVG